MRWMGAVLAIGCGAAVLAVETGQTRAEVLAELGKPQNIMAAGQREVLIYANGRVTITGGKVSEFKGAFAKPAESPPPDSPAPGPVPVARVAPAAPVAPVATPPAAPPRSTAIWHTDLDEAQAIATKENKLILALFTGTDWCGPCQEFKAEVEDDPQFAGIFSGSFVFFKSDWLRNTPQPEAVKDEVGRLKRKYFVTLYPTLLVLNARGERLDKVEWTQVQEGSFKERMIEAIDNSRKATKGGKNRSSWLWRFWPF